MNTLKKIKDYIDESITEFDFICEGDEKILLITGNKMFKGYGDEELREITDSPYITLEEKLEELKNTTGKEWKHTQIIGYDQNEWQNIFYVPADFDEDILEFIQDYYFGHVSVYYDSFEEVNQYVPHHIEWEGKEAICKWLNLDPNDTKILVPSKAHTVYDYEEM